MPGSARLSPLRDGLGTVVFRVDVQPHMGRRLTARRQVAAAPFTACDGAADVSRGYVVDNLRQLEHVRTCDGIPVKASFEHTVH